MGGGATKFHRPPKPERAPNEILGGGTAHLATLCPVRVRGFFFCTFLFFSSNEFTNSEIEVPFFQLAEIREKEMSQAVSADVRLQGSVTHLAGETLLFYDTTTYGSEVIHKSLLFSIFDV